MQTLQAQDHQDLMDKVAAYSDAALEYTIKDLGEVIKIQEKGLKANGNHGKFGEKIGIYTDHWHYCVMEKTRRQKIQKEKV